MTFVIGWFTYQSFDKLWKEDTNISINYTEDEVQLPSVTVCTKWLNTSKKNKMYHYGRLGLPKAENWTFNDFMVESIFAKDYINSAHFRDQISDKIYK